jgi:predicted DNA-binding WGR domain protein
MQIRHDAPALPSHLYLQAIDPARNIARRYAIEASADLFGHIIIDLTWGRIGTKGQSRAVSFVTQRDADRFVCATLTRRASAKKRLGVAYLPV